MSQKNCPAKQSFFQVQRLSVKKNWASRLKNNKHTSWKLYMGKKPPLSQQCSHSNQLMKAKQTLLQGDSMIFHASTDVFKVPVVPKTFSSWLMLKYQYEKIPWIKMPLAIKTTKHLHLCRVFLFLTYANLATYTFFSGKIKAFSEFLH